MSLITLSKYGEIEFWLFMEEHTNTKSLRKDRDIYQTNALESQFFINNNKEGFIYGLKSGKSPMQVKNLIQSEDVLVRMVKELKFHKVKDNFQTKLREDMKQVQT